MNPVEKFWAWARKRLRAMDLADLKAGRQPIQRTAFKARVRNLMHTNKAKLVAKNYMASLKKTCKEVILRKGAATHN